MDIGKWWESQVESKLKPEIESQRGVFHRFVDSKAARGLVAAQPSDYLVHIKQPWSHIFVEAKASEKKDSLRQAFSMIRKVQIAHAALILPGHNPNGPVPYQFWFYSEPRNVVELWHGQIIVDRNATGKWNAGAAPVELEWSEWEQSTAHELLKRIK